jgi:hypothetical protein
LVESQVAKPQPGIETCGHHIFLHPGWEEVVVINFNFPGGGLISQ